MLTYGRYGSVKEDADSDDELKPVYDPPTGMAYAVCCLLTYADVCCLLTYAHRYGVCCLLTYADVWRKLTYSDVWRMLTYADVWRKLTYPDVYDPPTGTDNV